MATHTLEIPRENWPRFLRQVEALHRDRPVEVELVGKTVGAQVLTRGAPLHGITAEPETAHRPTMATTADIALELGAPGSVESRVIHATRLYAVQSPSGQLECLDIEDDAQTKALVRFIEPLLLPVGPEAAEHRPPDGDARH